MTDEEQKVADAAKIELEAQKKSLEGKSADELIEIIRETRNEAKERRLKEKELSDKLSAFESEKDKAAQEKKIAEGKKDEVINELTDKMKIFEAKAKQFDEYDKSKRDLLKKEIGDDNWLGSFDNLSLIDLEKLAIKFNAGVKLIHTDNGKKVIKTDEYFTMEELKNIKPNDYNNLKPEDRKAVMNKVAKSLGFHSKK